MTYRKRRTVRKTEKKRPPQRKVFRKEGKKRKIQNGDPTFSRICIPRGTLEKKN